MEQDRDGKEEKMDRYDEIKNLGRWERFTDRYETKAPGPDSLYSFIL